MKLTFWPWKIGLALATSPKSPEGRTPLVFLPYINTTGTPEWRASRPYGFNNYQLPLTSALTSSRISLGHAPSLSPSKRLETQRQRKKPSVGDHGPHRPAKR